MCEQQVDSVTYRKPPTTFCLRQRPKYLHVYAVRNHMCVAPNTRCPKLVQHLLALHDNRVRHNLGDVRRKPNEVSLCDLRDRASLRPKEITTAVARNYG